MKQVKTQDGEVKKDFKLDILNLLRKGVNPSKIAIHLSISIPRLSYHLKALSNEGIIKKIGYGVWQVNEVKMFEYTSHKARLKDDKIKNVRGHAFVWKIRPNKRFDWKNLLDQMKVPYETKGIANTPRITLEGKKIWLGQNNITIFEPKWNSFFASNPIEAKKEAIFDLIKSIELIKSSLNIEFKYNFTCRRQHYGFVNNKEAIHFEKEGKKILIKNEKGYWFSIDFSQNLYKEAETIHERDADIDGMNYQNYMNSHERTNFKVTPEFTLEAINKVTQNQLMFAENMKSHIDAIQKLGNAVEELKEEVKKINSQSNKVISTT